MDDWNRLTERRQVLSQLYQVSLSLRDVSATITGRVSHRSLVQTSSVDKPPRTARHRAYIIGSFLSAYLERKIVPHTQIHSCRVANESGHTYSWGYDKGFTVCNPGTPRWLHPSRLLMFNIETSDKEHVSARHRSTSTPDTPKHGARVFWKQVIRSQCFGDFDWLYRCPWNRTGNCKVFRKRQRHSGARWNAHPLGPDGLWITPN